MRRAIKFARLFVFGYMEAMIATLQTIINKTRLLTARDSTQLPDQLVIDYINTYYEFDLPADLQILKMEDSYTFSTQPGVECYAFDSENFTYLEQPCRIGGYPSAFFTDPNQYWAIRPEFTYIQQIATGDGTAGPYSGTISSTPFHRSYNTSNNSPSDTTLATFPFANPIGQQQEVIISAQISNSYSLNVTDTPSLVSGSGLTARYQDTSTLIGDVAIQQSGSINFFTGQVSGLTFSQNVPAGKPINASVYVYAASRPRYVLFFQNQIRVSPVPDNAYIIELKTYRKPAAMLNSASIPELQELWQLLAVGAAMKIFEDNADPMAMQQLQPSLEKYESLVRTRGLIQRTRTRTPTIYSMGGVSNALEQGTPYFSGS